MSPADFLQVTPVTNRWHIWKRSAFYQSRHASGFRDQVQDVMEFLCASPELARTQTLLADALYLIILLYAGKTTLLENSARGPANLPADYYNSTVRNYRDYSDKDTSKICRRYGSPALHERLKALKKENIYVALINTLLGMGVASLLRGSVLAYALIVILIGTIIFIERKLIYEKIFRRKKLYAVAGYSVLAAVMLVFLFFITAASRDTSLIVKRVNGFLQNVTAGDYRGAYEQLSEVSKKAYALNDFANDHKENRIKFQNFTIHDVIFNKYDKRQAVAMVSSPFMLYGHETLNLEMIKEGREWRICFSRNIVNPNASHQGKSKKKKKENEGSITNFLNKLF